MRQIWIQISSKPGLAARHIGIPILAMLLTLAFGLRTVDLLGSVPDHAGPAVVNIVLYRLLPVDLAALALVIALHWHTTVSRSFSNRRLAAKLRRIRRESSHDPLTGVINRREFFTVLDRELKADRPKRTALILIDIDGFKGVNDTFGHDAGDAALATLASRFQGLCRAQGAVLARIGGDEFAVLVRNADDRGTLQDFAARCVAAAAEPITIRGRPCWLGASLGVALAPEHGVRRIDLLRRADSALYAAKAQGRGTAFFFDPEIEVEANHHRRTERELRAALLCNEIEPFYQAIYSADGTRILGVEALVRWRHPVQGYIPPSEFIPIAERSALIVELGTYILRRACRDALQWPDVYVSVNLSPYQIIRSDIVTATAEILRETGLPPRRLVLEITESAFIGNDTKSLKTLARLREIGVQIALDDFGTGYSSLGYLQRFHFDKLKVDQSFVTSLSESADAATILHAIVNLGRGLGLTVTAEGIETADQQRFLCAAGCHEIQGYLFSKPQPAFAVTRLITGVLTPLPIVERA